MSQASKKPPRKTSISRGDAASPSQAEFLYPFRRSSCLVTEGAVRRIERPNR
jgi:hypothetical protein